VYTTFQTPGRIIHGEGCIESLASEVERLGCGRVLIVTDPGIVECGAHRLAEATLAKAGIPYALCADVESDPSPACVERCAKAFKDFSPDVIVGLGGGSSMDVAKAVALVAAHGTPAQRFFGIELVPSPCPPTILVPTTAGTASETTSITVLLDPETQSKKGIVSSHLFAKTVILDPLLTLSLPPFWTATTGIDALVHAIESYVNLGATPITEGMCLQAMRLIVPNIRKAYANGGNREARAAMLYGASLAGMGFSNTQNGIIHAIGHAVLASHHLPHGLLMAAASPMGMAFNALAAPEKFATIAGILGVDCSRGNVNDLARQASEAMKRLLMDLDIAPGLAAHGVLPEEIPGIAERAVADARLMARNPRRATVGEVEALLHRHF
jgi:alcohol dehydrogenase class IV